MSEICKNCDNTIEVNFCSVCGQKKAKRIDRNYLKEELQYTVLHMNKGFFYSIRKLVRNPGKMAREFVEGNRVNHYKPLLLVFVLAGISAFLTNTLLHPVEMYARYMESQPQNPYINMKAGFEFMMKFYSFIMLLTVPFMAFFTWLAFKKWGYNYYENIIVNAYYFSLVLVFSIVVIIPLQFLLKGNVSLYMTIPTILSYLGLIGIYFWFYIELYNDRSAGSIIVRSLLMFLAAFVIFIILCIGIGILYAMYYLNH